MKDHKRILFVCGGSHVSGAEIVTLQVMQALQHNGHIVHCVVSGWNDGDFISRLKVASITYTVVKLGFFYLTKPLWTLDALMHLPKALFQYYQLQRAFQPDYVYHASYRTVLTLYPLLNKSKGILHVHDSFEPSLLNKYKFAWASLKLKRIIAVSSFIKKNLINILVEEEKISVVLNGVSHNKDVLLEGKVKSNSPLHIGIVGQIVTRKGHEDLIEALNILKNKKKKFICLIFGKGDEKFINHLKNKILQYQLDNCIQWKGYVREQKAIYQSIDVLVAPTRSEEPFALVALEPAFYGIPVIATQKGGFPESVQHGKTGFLVEPCNPQALADHLCEFMEDRTLLGKIGCQAKQHALNNFTAERMIKEIEDILVTTNQNG